MSSRERVLRMVEDLSEADLRVVERMLRGLTLPDEAEFGGSPLTAEERRANARAGLGALAHLPGSVDDFLREKREEVQREEERYLERHSEAA